MKCVVRKTRRYLVALFLLFLGGCGYEAVPVIIEFETFSVTGERDSRSMRGVSDPEASTYDVGIAVTTRFSHHHHYELLFDFDRSELPTHLKADDDPLELTEEQFHGYLLVRSDAGEDLTRYVPLEGSSLTIVELRDDGIRDLSKGTFGFWFEGSSFEQIVGRWESSPPPGAALLATGDAGAAQDGDDDIRDGDTTPEGERRGCGDDGMFKGCAEACSSVNVCADACESCEGMDCGDCSDCADSCGDCGECAGDAFEGADGCGGCAGDAFEASFTDGSIMHVEQLLRRPISRAPRLVGRGCSRRRIQPVCSAGRSVKKRHPIRLWVDWGPFAAALVYGHVVRRRRRKKQST